MSDTELRRRVVAELTGDPRVNTETYEVLAVDATVTLRGTVGSLWLKLAVGKAVRRVRGVASITNELRVQLRAADRRSDEDLRGDVLEALMLDISVPMTVDAQARDGLVTLTGTAQWHYQREAAESRTANVPGVAGIDNVIILTQTPGDETARESIIAAFQRNAALDAGALHAETSAGGLVTLSGKVNSLAAHDHAVAAAWSASGVIRVDDQITVECRP